ncbi:MAG TPA: 50S ribosomal protein L15 [Verrucomicrobia bacterium]|nr:MAG: 50S ribosomal protein L15 [Lentisphaerae bacterium GWF2_57_35]HBA83568.1 50S ribosomal protein L15 [Verrucomicrobiota bacterium]
MNLHSLTNTKGARHRRIRVGRGESSGKGKTSGKGNKGQMSRTGHKHKPLFEGGQMKLLRRIPKRGFTNINRVEYVPVNLKDLSRFEAGSEVTMDVLRKAGLVGGQGALVKILGTGSLDRKLTVKAHAFSAAARSSIEAAGGACEVVK